MTNIASIPEPSKPPDPIPIKNPEPVRSCNSIRVFLASFKGGKKIDHATLIRLVKKEGLPKHDDPFGSGHWCFLESECRAWVELRMAGNHPQPLRGPGRPRKNAA